MDSSKEMFVSFVSFISTFSAKHLEFLQQISQSDTDFWRELLEHLDFSCTQSLIQRAFANLLQSLQQRKQSFVNPLQYDVLSMEWSAYTPHFLHQF